jgi:uncharacterized protein
MSEKDTSTLAPVPPEERLVVLDVLRGVALLGIIIMNLPGYSVPAGAWFLDPRMFPGKLDRAAEFVMTLLVEGKANSIFSFLFGLGLTIQMQRAEARASGAPKNTRGKDLAPVHLRRLSVLLLLGAAHGLLVWRGDVLQVYAVIGLLLFAVRRARDRVVFGLIGLFLAFPIARAAWALYTREPRPHTVAFYVARAHEHLHVFQAGTYVEQITARATLWKEAYLQMLELRGMTWVYCAFSVTMLLGLVAGRRRVFSDVQANAARIRRLVTWCLGLGLGAAALLAILEAVEPPPTGTPTVIGFCESLLYHVNRPLLCLAYIGAIALLCQRPRWSRLFAPLSIVGRMPLTNYLTQSLIATTIFYSHGLGLFGKVGPALGLLVSFSIFGVQIACSRWWLGRFRFGPLEWLWRGVTYGTLPPLRIEERAEALAVEA